MQKLRVAMLLVLVVMLAGCGSNSNSGNINGNWKATLTDANGTQVFSFTTSIIESGNGTLSMSNFSFSTSSSCFVSGQSESGTFGLAGNFNGNVSGTFGMNIQSVTPPGNTLALSGTVTGNTISGTWMLTGGAGCSGNGNFTMTRS